MPAADQATVNQLAGQIDFTRDGIESSYGKDAQRATSTFADEILSDTRSKDTGEAGELLNTMLVTIDEAELGGFRKLPIIGQVAVSIDKLRRRYQKVDAQIDEIITKLEAAQAKLVADISMYDTMYQQNAQQYRELKMTVLAGKKALADFRATQLPALEAEAAKSGDAMQAQVLKDFKSKLDRFEKRLDDLDRISVVTLQTAPQIKIIQNADQTIVDKIDTTISTTIPVWKSQMVIALGLSNQRKALDLQNKADDVTNKLLQRNAAALHKGAVDAEKANQRSVVEIDTLEKINSELIATLKETVQIQKEGKANREAAQVKMRQIESDLKQAFLENAQQM
ncbi:toxic anion resistance protein [Bifidobacterium sp. SO4]|nr:toxic anion resistance protein [Bifidobacterium sp. SO4]